MKKTYIIAILLVLTFGAIALKPEAQAQQTPPVSDVSASVVSTSTTNAAATTHTDSVAVQRALAPVPIPTNAPVQESNTATAPVPNVTIIAGSSTYAVYVEPHSTVLDAMQEAASSSTFTFTGHDYSSLGFFVESINGKADTDGSYWFLYVNGKSSDTGASETALNAGDTVEWRYEKNY